MICSAHPPWLDHSNYANYAWRRAQVMKLLIVRFINAYK
jgi:hypothetical protein